MMVDRKHRLPMVEQCRILELSRSSVYSRPQPVSAADLALMHRIDELHLQHPFAGSRMLRDILRNSGVSIGRKHVATLMRRMGIEALYQRPRTSRQAAPGPQGIPILDAQSTAHRAEPGLGDGHHLHSHAPRFCVFDRCPGLGDPAGLVLAAIQQFDGGALCLEAVEAAIRSYGTPEILNTDQGSQFTDTDFVDMVQQHGVQISMDGKGSWRDNVFVERLWKSVKYEEVYLHAYDSVTEARQGLQRYFTFYNQGRPHSFLDGRTPDMVYFAALPQPQAA